MNAAPRRGTRWLSVAALGLAVALAGCAQELARSPLGPCGDDARAIGGFAELEALLPATLGPDGRAPDRVDSGRSCSDAALGSLKAHGVTEMRFAGATWNEGESDATVIAVLATPNWVPPLEAAWVEEFYESGARAARKTDNITTSRPTFEGAGQVFRLDALNDLSQQTVVTWQVDGRTNVVVVATEVGPTASRAEHDARVELAVAAAAAAPGGVPGSSAPAPAGRA